MEKIILGLKGRPKFNKSKKLIKTTTVTIGFNGFYKTTNINEDN